MSKRGQASRQLVERSHTLTCEVGTDTMCLKKGQKKGQNNVSEKGTDTTCLKKYGESVWRRGRRRDRYIVSEKVWRQNGDVLVTSYFLIDQTPTCRCPGVQLHRQCPSNSVVWQQRWPSLPEEWRALQHVRHVMTCEATCEARTCEQHVATCEATCEATCQACEARRLSLPEET
jgi:hypothetical protein